MSVEPPALLAPAWETSFPGLFQAEIDALRAAGAKYEIDQGALQEGVLKVALRWPIKGTSIALEVTYPDQYPYFRPHVLLKEPSEAWPHRHCSPVDGTLCLLGRDSAQWSTSWTLARLLQEQLESALSGGGDEDPQGEPTEVWWNCFNGNGSYVLVQSEWDVEQRERGFLRISYRAKKGDPPIFRGLVLEVQDENKNSLFQWRGMTPPELQGASSTTVPWIRVEETLWPLENGKALSRLFFETEFLRRQFGRPLAKGVFGFPFAALYPSELALGKHGPAWLFALVHGPHNAFGKGQRKNPTMNVLPTYRAGPEDIGFRVPAVGTLRTKVCGLIGLGAIGGPTAIDLARNGIKRLNLMDADRVEPGNSIRWPLGAAAWGKPKSEALAEFIQAQYDWTEPVSIRHLLGGPSEIEGGDERALTLLFDSADVIVDATASFGVTNALYPRAAAAKRHLIQAYATPPLQGGCVVSYAPAGACPICIEHHRHAGSLVTPSGHGDIRGLIQPIGCSENTFPGASFDLTEIALQAVRTTVATLKGLRPTETIVHTITFVDGSQEPIAPIWSTDVVAIHPDCGCNRGR